MIYEPRPERENHDDPWRHGSIRKLVDHGSSLLFMIGVVHMQTVGAVIVIAVKINKTYYSGHVR